MTETLLCLDTSVLIKFLTAEEPEEQADAAERLILRALNGDARIVVPALAWAEVGSVLRKKVRQALLDYGEAQILWSRFLMLPIDFVDAAHLRNRAWDISEEFGLPTLYDAAFLACAESAPDTEETIREFWTADEVLLRQLGENKPRYVHRLV